MVNKVVYSEVGAAYVRRWFEYVVRFYASEMVPVLVVAAAECLGVTGGTAAEVDARHVVDDRTDVSELHVLLSDTFTSTASSCLQLSLLRCSVHNTTRVAA